jgi:hypothetical protein
MATTIPATSTYRAKVAAAAAVGGTLPAATTIAFGTGVTAPGPDDTTMETMVHSKPLEVVTADVTVLTCQGTLTGTESTAAITEVGIFDADGGLMGRRTFKPKELEAESSLEFTLDFQF